MPTTTLPKFTAAGFDESWPCVPVPLSTTVAGEPGALLVMEMLPEALPAAVGANFAAIEVFCPTGTLMGSAPLVTEKPAPDAVI